MPPDDPSASDVLDVAVRVAMALSSAGARHVLVGSLASSLRGDPRSTNDVDFLTDLKVAQIPRLSAALGAEFDVDEGALGEAIRAASSWNIYFLPWMLKVDLFAAGPAKINQVRLQRAIESPLGGGALRVLRADDIVLSKLTWYRDGGAVSDQQWRDILGVLRVSGGQLDRAYLDQWATDLGVGELLHRAWSAVLGR
jgi:hypothetical protein